MGLTFRVDRDHRQFIGGIDFQHREVGQIICANQHPFIQATVITVLQGDQNLIGIFNHVLVGQDIALIIHDHAGTEGGQFGTLLGEAAHITAVNVDHGRRGAAYRFVIADRFVIIKQMGKPLGHKLRTNRRDADQKQGSNEKSHKNGAQ